MSDDEYDDQESYDDRHLNYHGTIKWKNGQKLGRELISDYDEIVKHRAGIVNANWPDDRNKRVASIVRDRYSELKRGKIFIGRFLQHMVENHVFGKNAAAYIYGMSSKKGEGVKSNIRDIVGDVSVSQARSQIRRTLLSVELKLSGITGDSRDQVREVLGLPKIGG